MTLFHTRHNPLKNYFLSHPLLLNGRSQIRRLYHGLSHFQNHKFKHSFENTQNQLCFCGLCAEPNTQILLLHHPLFINPKCTDNDLNLTYFSFFRKASSVISGNTFQLNAAVNYG